MAASEISDAVPHRHLVWFGLEIILPVTPNGRPNDDGQDDLSEDYVRLIVRDWSGELTGNAALHWIAVHHDGPSRDALAFSRAGFLSTPASCNPLCDTARHERSGVQLI